MLNTPTRDWVAAAIARIAYSALSATPDPTRTQVYAAAYRRFLQHLDALTPLQRG